MSWAGHGRSVARRSQQQRSSPLEPRRPRVRHRGGRGRKGAARSTPTVGRRRRASAMLNWAGSWPQTGSVSTSTPKRLSPGSQPLTYAPVAPSQRCWRLCHHYSANSDSQRPTPTTRTVHAWSTSPTGDQPWHEVRVCMRWLRPMGFVFEVHLPVPVRGSSEPAQGFARSLDRSLQTFLTTTLCRLASAPGCLAGIPPARQPARPTAAWRPALRVPCSRCRLLAKFFWAASHSRRTYARTRPAPCRCGTPQRRFPVATPRAMPAPGRA